MSLPSRIATGVLALTTAFGLAGCASVQSSNVAGQSCGGLSTRDAPGLGFLGGMVAGTLIFGPLGTAGGAVAGSVTANNAAMNCSYMAPAQSYYPGYVVH